MENTQIRKHVGSPSKSAAPQRLTLTKSIPFAGLLGLCIAILSISGCTGVTGSTNSGSTGKGTNPPPVTTPTPNVILNASATSLSFSGVKIGANSVLPVVFTNAGNSDVTISNVAVSGAGFSASGIQSGQIVTAGKTVTLNVTFAPSGSGSVSGSITLTSNATNSSLTVSLTGSGTQSTAHSVGLSWTASTSVVAGYNVYRSQTSGGPYTKLDSSLVPTNSYTDATVVSGQTYYYVATSVSSVGVESADSTQATAVVP